MPTSNQLYALAICAHLPPQGNELEVRHFASEAELATALRQACIRDGECSRIVKALKQSGRTLAHFTREQADTLRAVPLMHLPGPSMSLVPRPGEFDVERTTARAIAYQMLGPQREPTSSGGVLPSGQQLWLDGTQDYTTMRPSARAFVEDIGLIVLDTRWLRPKHPVVTTTAAQML